jgi:integrase
VNVAGSVALITGGATGLGRATSLALARLGCSVAVNRRQESLGTKDREIAERLFQAKNEAHRQPIINLQIARAYLMVADPEAGTRTWQYVMDELVKLKEGETEVRWRVAIKDRALDGIRHKRILETRAEHFLSALEGKKVSTNIYLRRIHNFALSTNWLPVPVIPKRQWPAIKFKEKRAIKLDEHLRIVERETNPERRAFYQLAWHLGASQSDIAFLDADSINWDLRTLSYSRKKSTVAACVCFGEEAEKVLRALPSAGPLFPYLRSVRAGDRATEFKQRCVGLGITGVSLHSYRYAWAQRAQKAGYPERFAQVALGHGSKTVHRAYAKTPDVIPPALDTFESAQSAQKLSLCAGARAAC